MTCKKCVLDSHYPNITFDSEGICNYCRSMKDLATVEKMKVGYRDKLETLIEKHRDKYEYDCIVSFSGGKDSTYTLYLMREVYGLKILSFSFDNWFQSERAMLNIRSVVKSLRIDHVSLTINFEIWKKIIQSSLSNDLFSKKAMERASTICTICLSLIRFFGLKMAIEKNIPFLVLGLSPGQAPLVTSIFKTNPQMVKTMQKAVFKPLYRKMGDVLKPYFLDDRHFQVENGFPYIINPLAIFPYDEFHIYEKIDDLGWNKPEDTDPNSTNCLLNAFAIKSHIDTFGFHPYAFDLAKLVREDRLDRETAKSRLNSQIDARLIEMTKKKLDLE
ncbi:MAG: hypothetical protein GTO02_05255 [Candidatus Dadabacteria bacterium]|nr:hypothetical protein [Candidatus Dadabacteria bacterium]